MTDPQMTGAGLPVTDTKWTGTQSQIEWAEQIKPRAGAEFDRVALALARVAKHQHDQARADTLAIIEILKEKRAEVMANSFAGYFIREWQELTDQVRRMIHKDPRYRAIRDGRPTSTQRTKT